jgi:hypothetical protein
MRLQYEIACSCEKANAIEAKIHQSTISSGAQVIGRDGIFSNALR